MCFPGRYLHLNVSQFSDPSSVHRLARVKALPAPQNPETVQHILGDTVDKEYPIFRTDTASDHVDTLCTGVWCVCTHICVHVCMHECMCMHFSLKDVGMRFVLGATWRCANVWLCASTTALFQVTDGVLKVYRGNPATSGVQPVLTFSLPKGTS